MTPRSLEAEDVQALVESGFSKLTAACFLLLRVRDPAAARAWLHTAPITTAAALREYLPTALQVALSAPGLRALGVPEHVLAGFSTEFLSGMAGDEARSRRLGDIGANAPQGWAWGGEHVSDVLVALYAEADGLGALRDGVVTEDFNAAFATIAELSTSNMHDHEPFGFADGVSQPAFDFAGRRRPGSDADLAYGNLLAAGELLLGYPNEYGRITDRPLLDPVLPGANLLPRAVDDAGRRDLGRNGTYLVFRQLAQDVQAFWRFAAAHGDAVALAETMVGRRLSGEPLLPLSATPIRGVGPGADDVRRNRFTYAADPDGRVCPLGAHVRRANPRTGDMPGSEPGLLAQGIRLLGFAGGNDLRDDVIASSRFHRILRRGREYGRTMSPEQAALPETLSLPETGLHFICLNANIERQFEFIQNAWLASAKFDGLTGEADPLVGNREPFPAAQATDGFDRLRSLPRFVTVRGGGYFFLPGLRALRFFASA
jgi:Dyp-type peroxidase family